VATVPPSVRALLSRSLFPTVFFGGLGFTAWGLAHGQSRAAVVYGSLVGAIIALTVFERILPAHARWTEPRGDVGTDLWHMGLTQLLTPRLVKAAALGTLFEGAAVLSESTGGSLWPHEWPLILQLVLAMVGTDLLRYWAHRLSHTVPWLWRFHAVHHSPQRLYWLNAVRFHPVDKAVHTLLITVPLVLTGASGTVLALVAVWSGIHGMFQHCNIDVRLGWLNYIFPMAELHRFHHSLSMDEANHNYGNNVVLWDLVFGTYLNPPDRTASPNIGVSGMVVPESYVDQLLLPVSWAKWRIPSMRARESA
jgi:sterol desaturase/sphingolipid hydroxylase (fatty acid hydroxylase superfamily)